jgi:hypothetical protein
MIHSLPLGAASECKVNGEHKVGEGPAVRPLLTQAELRAALGGISERKFQAMQAEGLIPAPLELGPRCARWTSDDLAEIVRRLPRRERQAEPQTLARGRRARIDAMKSGAAA